MLAKLRGVTAPSFWHAERMVHFERGLKRPLESRPVSFETGLDASAGSQGRCTAGEGMEPARMGRGVPGSTSGSPDTLKSPTVSPDTRCADRKYLHSYLGDNVSGCPELSE